MTKHQTFDLTHLSRSEMELTEAEVEILDLALITANCCHSGYTPPPPPRVTMQSKNEED